MAKSINRRNWIKSSAFLGGGLALFPGAIGKLTAAPLHPEPFAPFVPDQAGIPGGSVPMKARLMANENPFGPSPAARKAYTDAVNLGFQYPIDQFTELTAKIASYEGIAQENVSCNSGSSPLLMAAAYFYAVRAGKTVITGLPSYEDLPSRAELLGAKINRVPLTSDYKLDLAAMEAAVDANTGIVYICNPNNPTGTVIEADKLRAFCERVSKKTLVFVDEAYIDYLPDSRAVSLISAVKAGQNVIVARTFSKLYGFAGLRFGYAIAHPDTHKSLALYTTEYNVSAPTLTAAAAAYREMPYMDDAKKKTFVSRDFLYATLKKEGYDYIPSVTNFVMFQIKMDGTKFTAEMLKRGVAVKTWKFIDKDWCRVSIGRMDEMQAFASAFAEIS